MSTDVSIPGRTTTTVSLHCVIVTPERTVLDDRVDFVVLPLYDGEMGILPGHSPIIGRLGWGELRTRLGPVVRRYFIDSGFAQVRDDVVTILTKQALAAELIDSLDAEDVLDFSRIALPSGTEKEQLAKERAVARARALLRVAERGL